jgi:OOP family OmpA-OmpF porin
MKRNLLLCTALILLGTQAGNAQFLNKLKKKAEAAVNKAIDGEPVTIKKPQVQTQGNTQATTQPQNTTTQQTQATETKAAPIEAYAKYDFIPGQNLIYSDTFTGEAMGELPAGWNSNGNGAVTKLNNFEGNWMRMDQHGTYLAGKDLVSTDNFTVEFDVIFDLKFKGYGYPEFYFGMLSTGKIPAADNSFLNDQYGNKTFYVTLNPGNGGSTHMRLSSYKKTISYFSSPVKSYDALEKYYGKIAHFAMQAQKERIRLWINGDKIFDAPKGLPAGDIFNQLYFKIGSSNYADKELGYYVSSIKVAQGAPDMRNKLINEGRFSTSGILFDVNAATIKAESNGILLELAQVLKDNPTVKLNIIGHTDADGNAAANQKLSLARAESVKNSLVANGIEEARLQITGKGATLPVASNKTETGKAQNRRVEFVKL